MHNFRGLINMDPVLTVDLVNESFTLEEQKKFIESINGHIKEQYEYLEALLSTNHDKI